jgi:hypothetical protein
MDVKTALDILAQLSALAPVPLEAHKQGQLALQALKEMIDAKEEK